MHPMLLHLPIGFFVLAVVMLVIKGQFKRKAFQKTYQFILNVTALTTAIAALMGVALSREGGYDETILRLHLNFGVAISLLTGFLIALPIEKPLSKIYYSIMAIGFILIVFTGHLGATLTHGENYVLAPLMKSTEKNINPDSLTIFSAAIMPVLEKKCISCHNPKKKKGELILTDEVNILKGGEEGLILIAGNAPESDLIKRIHLDEANDDHMPPLGKPQLTLDEITLLTAWINRGADFKTIWKTILVTDTLKILSANVLLAYQKPIQKQYPFDFASGETIKNLNTPFRNVSQVSADVPALKADFYLAQFFKPENLEELSKVKSQLTELNLAGMPVTDKDAEYLSGFKNLENLNLNNTKITDEAFRYLISITNLKKLSIAGTQVTVGSLQNLFSLKNLQEVYLWDTSISLQEVDQLKSKQPTISWNIGYQPNEKEKLKLTPPILKNEVFLLDQNDQITLSHNLPGTIIRYSLDGTSPDSVNGIQYSQPFNITTNIILKTIATKDGWFKSSELEYRFYTKGVKPINSQLITTAHKDYKAKGITTLTDELLGDVDNFRDGGWLGFKETNFQAIFYFDKEISIKELTLLYNRNIGSHIMPPQEIEIWVGDSASSLRFLKKLRPIQPTKYEPNIIGPETILLDGTFKVIKLMATPIGKLPTWHSGKGEKAWLMISEVIFN